MRNIFVKPSELTTKDGGYLYSKTTPVTNEKFVELQREAELLVKTAEAVKKADFKGKKPDNFDEIVKAVEAELKNDFVEYLPTPKAPKRSTTDKLKNEALAWIDYEKLSSKAEKVNESMQRYNLLFDFEKHGLFFTEGVVKLRNIYTTSEITEAIKVLSDHQ